MKARPAAKAEHRQTGHVKREPMILVVDDFADNRAMYAEYLVFSGFRVEEASNGLEAIEKAREVMPDLIVMDLALPVLDGWEATRRLKNNPRTSHIPIIALTGHALEGHSKSALEAGCDAFLAKPCLPETLVANARRLMRVARGAGKAKADR